MLARWEANQSESVKEARSGLTARLVWSLKVALFWFSAPSHRQGPGVPMSSLAPSPVKILSSRLPVAKTCSSYRRLSAKLRANQSRGRSAVSTSRGRSQKHVGL